MSIAENPLPSVRDSIEAGIAEVRQGFRAIADDVATRLADPTLRPVLHREVERSLGLLRASDTVEEIVEARIRYVIDQLRDPAWREAHTRRITSLYG